MEYDDSCVPHSKRFEDICRRVLELLFSGPGEHLGAHEGPPSGAGVNFIVRAGDRVVAVVEAQLHRYQTVPTPWLISAPAQAIRYGRAVKAERMLLIVASRLSDEEQRIISQLGVEVIDLERLYEIALEDGKLSGDLEALMQTVADGSS